MVQPNSAYSSFSEPPFSAIMVAANFRKPCELPSTFAATQASLNQLPKLVLGQARRIRFAVWCAFDLAAA